MLNPTKLLGACVKRQENITAEKNNCTQQESVDIAAFVKGFLDSACASGTIVSHAVSKNNSILPYQIMGIDGSAIYPDRHNGHDFYCINIAAAHFVYGIDYATAAIRNEPYVFDVYDIMHTNSKKFSDQQQLSTIQPLVQESLKACVDKQRAVYEYTKAPYLLTAVEDIQAYILFDGSFVYDIQDNCSQINVVAIESIHEYAQQGKIPFWYISRPYSKDLCAMLKKQCTVDDQRVFFAAHVARDNDIVEHISDEIAYEISYVPDCSIAGLDYIACIYMHVGDEVCRCELPLYTCYQSIGYATIIRNSIAIIRDQIDKGAGYPPVLAEAHAAAVCTLEDNALLDYYVEMDEERLLCPSNKSIRKKHLLV